MATGDVLLHPPLWEQARRDAAAAGAGALDFAPQLAAVQPLVAAADLGVCHLETPLAPPEGPFRGYPAFAAPPQVVPALAQTGYDACTTASNHSFDAGAEGVTRTLDALDAAGLASAGTARTPEEAERPTVLDVPGPAGAVRVALVSGTYGFNGVPAPGGQEWRGDALEEEALLREAAAARAAGAEVVVLALHWGEEYEQEPSAQQLQLAPRLLASPDVDLLLGHHAHVVQPVEQVGGEWVAYGLGNLLAAHSTQGEPLREGLAVRFVLTEQPDGRFATTQAGYAPLLVTDAPPHRVLDVAAALRAGGAPGASPERLAQAWERTTAVVGARGAAGAGLVPLSTP
ncbi:CapA family protein [Quadrisphaera sp. DSM 44207]|uniref:CapA family protein n=1 Tax=Quadrisphaera sp. DSM 44207 TaxID=1881057 RepID=UPI001C40A303|nr:CapA family protein [Quadrisphaera sp. DSM 44207]